jgi:hypothetical protein
MIRSQQQGPSGLSGGPVVEIALTVKPYFTSI